MLHFILFVIYDGPKENHIPDLENVKQLMLSTAEISTTRIIIAYETQYSYFSTFPP